MSKETKTIKLGLVPSPDLPANITNKLIDSLPSFLNKTVDPLVNWKPKLIIDPVVGSAEYMNQLMNSLIELKHEYQWDYVICLTDLPHFMNKHVVVADLNISHNIALVSIPSLGIFPMKKRIKNIIVNILRDLRQNQNRESVEETIETKRISPFSFIQRYTFTTGSSDKQTLEKQTKEKNADNKRDKDNEDEKNYTQEDTEKQADIRYIITSKSVGQIRLLAGMTYANRPWNALVSLKKIIVFALGTGIYITIFPTPWKLSTIYNLPRFITLMFVTILGMVVWMIVAHQLWEKKTAKGDPRLRKLYNYTTVTTLSSVIFVNYIILFVLFLTTIAIFVPPELFEAGTNIEGKPTIKHYLQLTWLITSLGTIAGSIGTTSENEVNIRQATYSYRQMKRYNEIQKESE